MRRSIALTAVAFILFYGSVLAQEGSKQYGKAITLTDTTKISDILAQPKEFVGKKVLVSGTIVDVCPKRGCWMELAGDKPFQSMRVKVNDGEIVFPLTAKGDNALVEGKVYEIKLTREEALQMKKHEAEEKGTKFDSTSVTGPKTIYQIKGIGAEIAKRK